MFCLFMTACSSSSVCEPYPQPHGMAPVSVVGGVRTACIAGVKFQGRFYVKSSGTFPDVGPELTGVVVPGCNDTGGTSEPDVPVTAYQAGNYCTSDVIVVGDPASGQLYVHNSP